MDQPSYEILKISKTYNPSWVNLETSTEQFPIYYDDLLDLKISKGSVLNAEIIHNIYLKFLKRKVQSKMLRKLATAPKSTSEATKLIKEIIYKMNKENKKEVASYESSQIVEEILETLNKYSYINDEKYAIQMVNKYLSSRKPRGKSYIKNALLSKGLTENQIEVAFSNLAEDIPPIDELKNAQQRLATFITKKKYKNAELDKQNQMALRFLTSQGYPIGVSLQALKALKDSE